MLFPSKVKILQKYITIGMFIALFQSIPKDITTENSQEDFPRVDTAGTFLIRNLNKIIYGNERHRNEKSLLDRVTMVTSPLEIQKL